jgi:arginine/lysine/ornithine decarboxylase
LVNGATVGNIAAICATVADGDAILVARDSHRSVYAGVALSGAHPIYLSPVRNDRLDGLYGVAIEDVRRSLDQFPEIRALHITSPSYYGFTAPVKAIAELAHERNLALIVDEAHGSHFVFNDNFPATALSCDADLVVQSPHKTLGSLTQSSLLHLKGTRVARSRLQSNLAMLQSSSPSALLLLSLDLAIDEMRIHGTERWDHAYALAKRIRQDLSRLEQVDLYGTGIVGTPGIDGYDPTKVVIDVDGLGTTGFAAGRWLRSTWQINPEFSDLRRIVFSITIGDTDESADLLVRAIRDLVVNRHVFHEHPNLISLWPTALPLERLSPRVAQQRDSVEIQTADAVGRVSAEMIVPYPPGVPLLVAGEEISAEVTATMIQLIAAGCRMVGLVDPTGKTLRVLPGL